MMEGGDGRWMGRAKYSASREEAAVLCVLLVWTMGLEVMFETRKWD